MVFGAACAMLIGADAHAQAGTACKPGGTVEETNACAVQVFQAADTEIAILYGDVMRALSAHERPGSASAPPAASRRSAATNRNPSGRACTTSA